MKKKKHIKKQSQKEKIRRTKIKVRKFLKDVDWFFDMRYWEKSIVWSTDPDTESPNCAAKVTISMKYQQSTITIFPCFFNQTPEDQIGTLVHELVHILTQPTKEISFELLNGFLVPENRIKEVNEEVTSRFTNRLMSLMSGGTKYLGAAYKEYMK